MYDSVFLTKSKLEVVSKSNIYISKLVRVASLGYYKDVDTSNFVSHLVGISLPYFYLYLFRNAPKISGKLIKTRISLSWHSRDIKSRSK